jgi:imidazolonepropionase-like amidohydrolase
MIVASSCALERGPDSVTSVESDVIVIRGGRALVGAALEELDDAVIVVEAGKITKIGSGGDVDVPAGAEAVDASGFTLTPGFIDAHVHIGFYPPAQVLAGGVTTVRDLAWPPERIFPLVEESRSDGFDGPRVIAAGPMITTPGGYPTNAGWAPPGTGLPVISPEEARAAVAQVHEEGAAVIKVALDPQVGPTLPLELLRAVVDAAHEKDLKVTAHIYGLDELRKAIEAGVDELAHMLMSAEKIPDQIIEQMVSAGMTIVPTLSVRHGLDRRMAIDNLRRFLGAGGRVVYGTDLGNAGPRPGIDRKEVKAMAKAGMSASEIIRSATVDSAAWLGLDDTGVLNPGMRADIVGFRGNPTTDTKALSAVGLVVRGTRVVGGG